MGGFTDPCGDVPYAPWSQTPWSQNSTPQQFGSSAQATPCGEQQTSVTGEQTWSAAQQAPAQLTAPAAQQIPSSVQLPETQPGSVSQKPSVPPHTPPVQELLLAQSQGMSQAPPVG